MKSYDKSESDFNDFFKGCAQEIKTLVISFRSFCDPNRRTYVLTVVGDRSFNLKI